MVDVELIYEDTKYVLKVCLAQIFLDRNGKILFLVDWEGSC